MEGCWQRAFVLHRRHFKETGLLVDLFSQSDGRVCVLAKGARSQFSQLKGTLQPFTPLLVAWRGRGQVKTLHHVEEVSLALPFSGKTLYCALYVNELLFRLLKPNIPFSDLFFDYLKCIKSLAVTDGSCEPTLRYFELALLSHLGYGIDFLHCVNSGESIIDDMHYSYREEKGFITSLVKNQYTFTGRQLQAFFTRKFFDTDTLSAAKRFSRIALRPYLGSKPLKSQELFRQFITQKPKTLDK